jgi:outer membrane protein TolC
VERQTVVSTVASSWWNVWYQQRLLVIAEQSLEVAREEQRVVQAQVKLGALAPVESVRVEAAVVTAESNIIQARNAVESAREGLLVLLGEAPSSPIELVLQAPPAERAASRPADQIIAEAMQGSPEMAQLRHAAEGARQRLEEARHGQLPQLDLVGSAGLSGYETSLGSSLGEVGSGDLKRWYIGAELAVPLGNRADRGSQQAREGEVAQAEQAVVAMERSLAQQIRAQVRIRESALASMRLAEANLKLAQETLAAERALLAAGRALQRDVLEAIRNLDNTRVAVEKASMDFLLAEVELKRLQGAL